MKLLDVCEPFFQFVCRLNRSARKGGDHDMNQVRHEIRSLLQEIRTKAQADPALYVHFNRDKGNLLLVLIFFVDFMVRNSALRFAGDWVNLADAEREQAGDEKFFDMLEQTLGDRSEVATERLAVYYTCMGLGFTGWYTGQPEYLRKKMLECAARLRGKMSQQDEGRICPDAYEHVDASNLVRPPGAALLAWAIGLALMVILLLFINAYLYHRSSSDLLAALRQIRDAKQAAVTVQAPGAARDAGGAPG